MKYIKTSGENAKLEIFVFPRSIHHDAMMQELDRIKNQTYGNWRRVRRLAVSAGFVDSKLNCFGESESLKLKSSPEDTELLKKQLGL
jgi:hypothetical protein